MCDQDHDQLRPAFKSQSAPATPTEGSREGKLASRRVTFPADDRLVTGYLDPPCPWKSADDLSSDELEKAYLASCQNFNSLPIAKIQEQLKEIRCFDIKHDCLDLRGVTINWQQCEALEEIFKRVQFHCIDLQDTALDDDTAAALFDMVEYYESAEKLNISHNRNIQTRGWQACSRMLKKASCLVELEASGTNLVDHMPILGRTLRTGSSLSILRLENCGINGRTLTGLMMALRLNSSVKELHLGDNRLGCTDALQIGNLLRANTRLRHLDLKNNHLNDIGVTHITEGLCEQKPPIGIGLSKLVLDNNQLTFNATPPLSRMLKTTRSLEGLTIGQNNITNEGVHCLREGLLKNRTLTLLGLENARVTCEGAVALAEYLADCPQIEVLDLRSNHIGVGGLLALSHSMNINTSVISLKINSGPPIYDDDDDSMKNEYEAILVKIQEYCERNKETVLQRRQTEAKRRSSTDGLGESVNRLLSLWSHVDVPEPEPTTTFFNYEPPCMVPMKQLAPPTLFYSPLPSPIPSPTRSRFRVSKVVLEPDRSNNKVGQSSSCLRKDESSSSSSDETESDESPNAPEKSLVPELKSANVACKPTVFSRFSVKPVIEKFNHSAVKNKFTVTSVKSQSAEELRQRPDEKVSRCCSVQTMNDSCDKVPDVQSTCFQNCPGSEPSGKNQRLETETSLAPKTRVSSSKSEDNLESDSMGEENVFTDDEVCPPPTPVKPKSRFSVSQVVEAIPAVESNDLVVIDDGIDVQDDAAPSDYPVFVQISDTLCAKEEDVPAGGDESSSNAMDELNDFINHSDKNNVISKNYGDLIDFTEKCKNCENDDSCDICSKKKENGKWIAVPAGQAWNHRSNVESISSSFGSDSAYSGSPTSLEESVYPTNTCDDSKLTYQDIPSPGGCTSSHAASKLRSFLLYPHSELTVLSTYPPRQLPHYKFHDSDIVDTTSRLLGISFDFSLLEGLDLTSTVPLSKRHVQNILGLKGGGFPKQDNLCGLSKNIEFRKNTREVNEMYGKYINEGFVKSYLAI